MNRTPPPTNRQSSKPILGFPDDLPEPMIARVDDFAARDERGEAVPALVARYLGDDGRITTFVWLPKAAYARALAKLGRDAEEVR